MQLVTYDFIKSKNPCYDPTEIGMPINYIDTPVNFITEYRSKVKRSSDIQWVLLREEFLTHKESALFVIWCAKQLQLLMKDPRSIKVLDVAEAYLYGNATKEELEIAIQDSDDACDADADAAVADVANYIVDVANYIVDAANYAAVAVRAAAGVAVNYVADAVNYAADAENVQIDKLLEIFKEKEHATSNI